MKPNVSRNALMFGLLLTLLLVLITFAAFAAGETSVSRLSTEQRQRRVGSLVPLWSGAEKLSSLSPSASLPASLDWRNYNGKNFVTPVRTAGTCGTWAFAVTAALESYTLRKNNTPGLNLDLSEQVLISCANAGGCGGGNLVTASNFIQMQGLPLESCYPYTNAEGSCSNACSDWPANAHKIDDWFSVLQYGTPPRTSVEDIKNALFMHGPLLSTMVVYSDFVNYQSGIYSYSSGDLKGGHAILIIGYDDPGQYFIVKNSWGTSWGEAGFFRIAYAQIFNVVKFGQGTIAYVRKAAGTSSWLRLLLDD